MRPRGHLTDAIIRAAAADTGNAAMRAAGRRAWSAEDYHAAAREYARLTAAREAAEARAEAREAGRVRHTCCRYCDLDIEGIAPFKRGEWMDRGGNRRCNDGKRQHAPVLGPEVQP